MNISAFRSLPARRTWLLVGLSVLVLVGVSVSYFHHSAAPAKLFCIPKYATQICYPDGWELPSATDAITINSPAQSDLNMHIEVKKEPGSKIDWSTMKQLAGNVDLILRHDARILFSFPKNSGVACEKDNVICQIIDKKYGRYDIQYNKDGELIGYFNPASAKTGLIIVRTENHVLIPTTGGMIHIRCELTSDNSGALSGSQNSVARALHQACESLIEKAADSAAM